MYSVQLLFGIDAFPLTHVLSIVNNKVLLLINNTHFHCIYIMYSYEVCLSVLYV